MPTPKFSNNLILNILQLPGLQVQQPGNLSWKLLTVPRRKCTGFLTVILDILNKHTTVLLIIKYIFIPHYLFTFFCLPNMLHFNSLETFLEFILPLPVTCTALGTCFLISPCSGPKTRIHEITLLLQNQPCAFQPNVPLPGLVSLIGILQCTSVLQSVLPGQGPGSGAVLGTLRSPCVHANSKSL